MGIPVWKPKKQQQEQEISLHSTIQQQSITRHHGIADGYTTVTTSTSQQQQPTDNSYPQSQLASPSRTITTLTARQQTEIENQIQQRFNEKQELLDQLKITISLLDQFLSIREISGQHSALPPIITDDLLAILTATTSTLNTTSPIMNDTNHYDHTSLSRQQPSPPPPTTTTTTATTTSTITSTRIPLRSYGRPDNDTSLTRLVDRMIESPPHASRWMELESNIASTHRRVCEQLNRLGASLTITTSIPFTTTSQSISPPPPPPPGQTL